MPARGRPGRIASPDTGETYARSEGLGVASFHMFANGAFSRDAKGDPLRVDAERLAALTPMDIAMGFQVKAHNPLTGLEGRAELLRKLGGVGLRSAGRPVRHRGHAPR